MSQPLGGILDTLNTGKNAVAIISSALVVDKATTSQERYEACVNLFQSIADKTESKVFDLLAAHVANPSRETLKPILDLLFVKK